MRSDEIEARLEELRVEDAVIWASIDVAELCNQVKGMHLSEAAAGRIAESNLIKEQIRSLYLALDLVLRSEAAAGQIVGDAEVKRRRDAYPLH